MKLRTLCGAVIALQIVASAQSNVRPGTDVSLSDLGGVASPTGAHSGTFPNGTQSWGVTTTSCNVGTVHVPWRRDMDVDHPQIGMWIYRDYQGRFEQVSLFQGVKHGFLSTNSPGCGSCPGGAGNLLIIGCSDTYGASLNYSHTYMAPPSEINPWTGIWESVGSHFDRGFPPVSGSQATDNVRSSINFPSTNQGYRNLVLDSGLNVTGATFWVSGYYNVIGEPDANRENNFRTRQINATWSASGNRWTFSTVGSTQHNGPALWRWSGATVNSANNNNGDDGRFYVAVKVTGPTNGLYHYEYAIQNRDNSREGGAFRIPICTGTTVSNLWFGDPDEVANNDWTASVLTNEIVFTAQAGNHLTWGNMFNVAFDSNASPTTANFSIDQALPGAGNASVAVAVPCPLDLRNLYLGAGCGSPTPPELGANGPALLGTANFTLSNAGVANGSTNYFVFSLATTAVPLGGGCTLWADPSAVFFGDDAIGDPSGVASLVVPIPADPALDGAFLAVQAVEFQSPGAFGSLDFSNGLKVKLGTANPSCN